MFRRLVKLGRVSFCPRCRGLRIAATVPEVRVSHVTASWFMNFLAVFFLRRSILNEWKPVR